MLAEFQVRPSVLHTKAFDAIFERPEPPPTQIGRGRTHYVKVARRVASLPFDRGGWFARDIVYHAIDAAHFIDNAVGYFPE